MKSVMKLVHFWSKPKEKPKFDLAPFINVAKGVCSPNLSFLAPTVQIWTILREIRQEFGPFPLQTGSEPKFDPAFFKSVA